MELILKTTIDTLGEEGDIVKVKDGYGRNYLLPQGKAVAATKSNLAILEKEKEVIEARKLAMKSDAESMAKKITGTTVIIEQRAGDEDKLFGSVTSSDIADKLASLGITVDKKKINLDEPIKTLGEYMVSIKVGYQTNAEVKVQVVPLVKSEEEA
ncbi:MAG: 50S ribosomal protein L9 [Proteobacteria bacterium]|nr:50S ribosomal protein L9 [Pseudomonadota bacterium]MBU1738686.1 50S ribosomal protein L9 [Pseudomonadota bacterium]